MGGGQVCLKWNSFHSSLASGFKSLWEEDDLVDVTLASDGRCIQAHKLILSACSPFFRELFKANPCQHPVIILQDTHFSELESLLCFVYKGEVNIDQENLPALLRTAETLQIRGLSGASEQVQSELEAASTSLEIEEIPVEDSAPTKRTKLDNRQSPSPRNRPPHYSRTKKGSSLRSMTRNLSVSADAVLDTQPTHQRLPKLEPMDHDLGADDETVPILSNVVVEEEVDSSSALFLGPVMDMNIQHDGRVSVSDTGQNNGNDEAGGRNPEATVDLSTETGTDDNSVLDGPVFDVEPSLQSLQVNQGEQGWVSTENQRTNWTPFRTSDLLFDVNMVSDEDNLECWDRPQLRDFLHNYSWLFVRGGRLGCSVCAEMYSRGGIAGLSEEWACCRVQPPPKERSKQQTSIRKKIFVHKLSYAHFQASSIVTLR